MFVPLVNGRIEGYSLAKDKNDKKLTPWYYQSMGRTMVAPLATPESIIWTTEMGNLYVGDSEDPKMRYRLETGSEILAPPAYRKPFVLVAAASGEVFAMQEMTGEREWKYGTGFPVTRTPAPVGDHVYVTSEEPALHCIDAKTGSMLWKAPHVLQFAAESKNRVYGVDDLGGLVVLDAAKGSVVGRIATDHPIQSLVNEQTDRVYLISDDGVIQCLREIDAKEPLYHSPKEPEMKKPEAGAQQQAEQPQPRPAEKSAPAKKESGQPAGEKPEKPAGPFGVPDSENPFGN